MPSAADAMFCAFLSCRLMPRIFLRRCCHRHHACAIFRQMMDGWRGMAPRHAAIIMRAPSVAHSRCADGTVFFIRPAPFLKPDDAAERIFFFIYYCRAAAADGVFAHGGSGAIFRFSVRGAAAFSFLFRMIDMPRARKFCRLDAAARQALLPPLLRRR